MNTLSPHVVRQGDCTKIALEKLNGVPENLTLFVINEKLQLIGTLTDGDIRRGLLNGLTIDMPVEKFMFKKFRSLKKGKFTFSEIQKIKENKIKLVPLLDDEGIIDRLIDFGKVKSVLPIDVVIMAGGRGERLRPLTDNSPKSLLKVGDKPILQHNIERLMEFGIHDYIITIRYLGRQIMDYFGNGDSRKIDITYIEENLPMGTIGSVSLIEEFKHDHVMVINSDLLTDIDFEEFYERFLETDADMAVASAPYQVNMPYAILETKDGKVTAFREKPTYTYHSNAGIYLIKRELLKLIPVERSFNATDFMELLLENKHKLVYYPILGYWLDIGKHEDYEKANEDIKNIRL